MTALISIDGLTKTYDDGYTALDGIDLAVEKGEILALLGPNGAGKTTLIAVVCGIVNPTSGSVTVGGFDIIKDYRKTRGMIGLVPQELTTDAFETVWSTVSLSRGMFGKGPNPAYLEKVLRSLSLWDKKDNELRTLSGGMKRRVLIAKALSHEPEILFLDEPTAGVDVELRKSMWAVVDDLRANGTTIILTTHYIEEAEAIADRIAVISKGKILLIEEKETLMRKLGRKLLTLDLQQPLGSIPDGLQDFALTLEKDGTQLVYSYDRTAERTGITRLMAALTDAGIRFRDLETEQSSLEDIFVELVGESA